MAPSTLPASSFAPSMPELGRRRQLDKVAPRRGRTGKHQTRNHRLTEQRRLLTVSWLFGTHPRDRRNERMSAHNPWSARYAGKTTSRPIAASQSQNKTLRASRQGDHSKFGFDILGRYMRSTLAISQDCYQSEFCLLKRRRRRRRTPPPPHTHTRTHGRAHTHTHTHTHARTRAYTHKYETKKQKEQPLTNKKTKQKNQTTRKQTKQTTTKNNAQSPVKQNSSHVNKKKHV